MELPEVELERVRKCSQCGLGLENQSQVTSSSLSRGMGDRVCSSSGRGMRKDATKVSELLEVLGEAHEGACDGDSISSAPSCL